MMKLKSWSLISNKLIRLLLMNEWKRIVDVPEILLRNIPDKSLDKWTPHCNIQTEID